MVAESGAGPRSGSPGAVPTRWRSVTSIASSSSSRRTKTEPSSAYAKASRASFQLTLSRSSPVSRSDSGSLPVANPSLKSSYSVPSRRV